jgi:hypothetical protein
MQTVLTALDVIPVSNERCQNLSADVRRASGRFLHRGTDHADSAKPGLGYVGTDARPNRMRTSTSIDYHHRYMFTMRKRPRRPWNSLAVAPSDSVALSINCCFVGPSRLLKD